MKTLEKRKILGGAEKYSYGNGDRNPTKGKHDMWHDDETKTITSLKGTIRYFSMWYVCREYIFLFVLHLYLF